VKKVIRSPKPILKDRQTKKALATNEPAHQTYSIFVDWMDAQAKKGVRFETMDEALNAFKQR
jgi:hypothetical protein